jgi:signal transduction histidine kinase
LNAIIGWSHILRDSTAPADIAEGVEVIERNARAQTQIIEDLLDMSRIISGNVRLDVQRVDLLELIRAAMESVKPMADAKDIRMTSALDHRAGAISGDPARLQQVLWNLLTNALKFTPKGGRIDVVLSRVDSHLEISVTDSGEGITPEFLPHVFDRFRQADASSTRSHRGLGLGLAIVRISRSCMAALSAQEARDLARVRRSRSCCPLRCRAWRLESIGAHHPADGMTLRRAAISKAFAFLPSTMRRMRVSW